MSARILAALAVVAAAVIVPVQLLRADEQPAVIAPVAAITEMAGTALADPAATDTAGAAATADTDTATAPADAGQEPLQAVGAVAAANAYVPVTPVRVLDTRDGTGGWFGKVPANGTVTVPIAGSYNVPGSATAVVLNLTVTEPEAISFVTVFPAGQALPNASSANIEYPGETIANLVTVPLSGGAVQIFTQTNTHLLADIAGYYTPVASAAAGRFQAVSPTRLLDTRDPAGAHYGMLGAGDAMNLDVAGLAGLPRDAKAAVLNLTSTEPVAAGFLSITPQWAPLGTVSSINVDRPGSTIANQVIVPLTNGWVTIYSAIPSHVLVDLDGWFSGPSAVTSTDGLFVPVTPGRLLDTRDASNSPLGGLKPYPNQAVDVAAASRRGIPASGFAALVVNATAAEASAAGYFTLYGAGLGRPLASNLNANWPGQVIPNHAIVPVSTAGFSFFTSSGASLLIDVAGYFTGNPPAPAGGYVVNGTGGPPSTGPHTFLYQTGGTQARWNPCATLTYRVNYNGAPGIARSEVDKAVAKVEAATGIDLVNLGDTNVGNDGTPPSDAKAVIAFVSPAENSSITNVAGLGGGSYYPAWNGHDPYVAKGFVLINETLGYSQGTGSSGLEGLLLHEIGHMMGLDHVNATSEAMYPTMHNLPSAGYGPGDREGLWTLGAAQGCLNTGASGFTNQSLPSDGPEPVSVVQTQLGATTGDDRAPLLVRYCHLGEVAALHPAAPTSEAEAITPIRLAAGTAPSAEMTIPSGLAPTA